VAERVFVVETDERLFGEWKSERHGLPAQLKTLGYDGGEVDVQQITSRQELFEVASAIKDGTELPGRAIVFQNAQNSDLITHEGSTPPLWTPPEKPADYDEDQDLKWVWKGDNPFSPYGRLLCGRLIAQAVPDVSYSSPTTDSEGGLSDADSALFEYVDAGGGHDEIIPIYGRYLAAINRHAAATGENFMSIVNGSGMFLESSQRQIEGADLFAGLWSPFVEPDTLSGRFSSSLSAGRAHVVARLLNGEYPGISTADQELRIPRQASSN
jgi:hypothetical protein